MAGFVVLITLVRSDGNPRTVLPELLFRQENFFKQVQLVVDLNGPAAFRVNGDDFVAQPVVVGAGADLFHKVILDPFQEPVLHIIKLVGTVVFFVQDRQGIGGIVKSHLLFRPGSGVGREDDPGVSVHRVVFIVGGVAVRIGDGNDVIPSVVLQPGYGRLCILAVILFVFDDLRQPPKGIEIIFGPVPQGIGDYGVKVGIIIFDLCFRVVPAERGGVCPRDPLRIVVVIRGDDPCCPPQAVVFVHRHIAAGVLFPQFPAGDIFMLHAGDKVGCPARGVTHGFFNDSCWQPVTVVFVFSYVAFRIHLPDQATVVRVVGVFSI